MHLSPERAPITVNGLWGGRDSFSAYYWRDDDPVGLTGGARQDWADVLEGPPAMQSQKSVSIPA